MDALLKKGIDAVALGRAAGNNKSSHFRRVFQGQGKTPEIVFCTPEYLFGTPATGSFLIQVDNTVCYNLMKIFFV